MLLFVSFVFILGGVLLGIILVLVFFVEHVSVFACSEVISCVRVLILGHWLGRRIHWVRLREQPTFPDELRACGASSRLSSRPWLELLRWGHVKWLRHKGWRLFVLRWWIHHGGPLRALSAYHHGRHLAHVVLVEPNHALMSLLITG